MLETAHLQWFVHNKQTRDFMECTTYGRCVVDTKVRCGGCRYYKAAILGACKPLPLQTKKGGVLPPKGTATVAGRRIFQAFATFVLFFQKEISIFKHLFHHT